MTDQTARIPYAHKIRYGVTGAPHLPNADLPEFGVIPLLIELIYSAAREDRPARVSASVTGHLTRDGKKVQPASQVAQHYVNGPDGWPEWLASEARHHAAGIRDAARQAAGQPDAAAPQFGADGCTCRPWTNCGDGARWCAADDTIDMVAGWDPGPGCPRHPAAGQPDTQQQADAHPPQTGWRVEVWDDGEWMPASVTSRTREAARNRLTVRRGANPEDRFRIVRETTTWTVEEDETR